MRIRHNATKGAVAWDSGKQQVRLDHRRAEEPGNAYASRENGRDGEVLTIITSAAVDTEITAAISNDPGLPGLHRQQR